jgi:hemerythrin-like domain-containing protein
MSKPATESYSHEQWEAVTAELAGSRRSQHPMLDTLNAEHRHMATMLKLLSVQLDNLEAGEDVEPHVLYELMHYMCHYPDAFHHPREDVIYQRAGELDGGLADSVDTLQREHDYLAERGEQTLAAIADWRDGQGPASAIVGPAREYSSSLYRHMSIEERLVFPQIHDVLRPEDWRELEQDDLLAPVKDPVFGPRVAREYRNLARKARRSLRRGVEDLAVGQWIGIETLLEGVEVLSMAVENGRESAREHLGAALDETLEMLGEAREQPGGALMLPARCAVNNTSHYFSWLREVAGITRDTAADLASLNRDLRKNLGLMLGDAPTTVGRSRRDSADGRTIH